MLYHEIEIFQRYVDQNYDFLKSLQVPNQFQEVLFY